MNWQVAYMLLMLLAAMLLTGMVAFAWRFRQAPGARYFLAFSACSLGWVLSSAVVSLSAPEVAWWALRLKYAFIAFIPVGVFCFALAFTGRADRLTAPLLAGLCVVPTLTQVIMWTPAWRPYLLQSIVFEHVGFLTFVSQIAFGPYFWVHTGHGYMLILSSMVLVLLSMWRAGDLQRWQGGSIFIGLTLPLITNILLITGVAPRQFDPMPIGLALAGLLFWRATLRNRLLQMVPVARNVVVDAMADGILTLDAQGLVLDINPAMVRLSGLSSKHAIGKSVRELQPVLADVLVQAGHWSTQVDDAEAVTATTPRLCQVGERQFELRVVPLQSGHGAASGHIWILHDVTDRLLLDQALRQRNEELELAHLALQEASSTDPLTGLRNRRFVTAQLDDDASLCLRRYGQWLTRQAGPRPQRADLGFYLLDLDDFKAVNDSLGHAAGDQVLSQVGDCLRSVFRDSDYLVRWGGEEFLVVARDSDRAEAAQVAERIRQAMASWHFSLAGGQTLQRTCSVGFASYPFEPRHPEAVGWQQVIDLADMALYQAKRGGRNTWRGLVAGDQARAEALASDPMKAILAGAIREVAP
jgi:diguanylate cyclase (GGDEF)-like protein/PAS domain S-box-containing protein